MENRRGVCLRWWGRGSATFFLLPARYNLRVRAAVQPDFRVAPIPLEYCTKASSIISKIRNTKSGLILERCGLLQVIHKVETQNGSHIAMAGRTIPLLSFYLICQEHKLRHDPSLTTFSSTQPFECHTNFLPRYCTIQGRSRH
jgi:hypothetical protein